VERGDAGPPSPAALSLCAIPPLALPPGVFVFLFYFCFLFGRVDRDLKSLFVRCNGFETV
jgi:hypothetical protein